MMVVICCPRLVRTRGNMILNRAELKKFEKELIRAEKVDLHQNLAILDALYDEACALGVFPLEDPLDGFDVDLKIARVINSVPKAPDKDSE
jgi:hypothetical protein